VSPVTTPTPATTTPTPTTTIPTTTTPYTRMDILNLAFNFCLASQCSFLVMPCLFGVLSLQMYGLLRSFSDMLVTKILINNACDTRYYVHNVHVLVQFPIEIKKIIAKEIIQYVKKLTATGNCIRILITLPTKNIKAN